MLEEYNSSQDFRLWLTSMLEQARDLLNMETGIASYIQDNNYQIVAVDSDMEGVFFPGMSFPLEETYCHQVVAMREPINYVHVGKMTQMQDHPVYVTVKLESYIAAPIFNDEGDTIGTINFTSLRPRESDFDDNDRLLVQAIADEVAKYQSQYLELVQ
jgi:GAF domain-containing protein